MRTSVLRRTAAAVLLSAVAFGLAACDNNQQPTSNYPTQSYGNAPQTAVTTTQSELPSSGSETPSTTGGAESSSGAQTTTP